MLTSCIDTNKKFNVLNLMQICDSNFPVGSFNHSYGMETYLRDDTINNTETFRKWLNVFFKNIFVYSDGLAIKRIYKELNQNNFNEIIAIDREITVQTISLETRNGSKLVGKRMIELFLDLYDSENLKWYKKKVKEKKAYGHPAIVFGLLMHEFNVNLKEAIVFHMYSTASTIIQNAVRTIPLGQKDGQILLKEESQMFYELYDIIENLDDDFFGCSTPGIELSQIKHETLIFRLFMS